MNSRKRGFCLCMLVMLLLSFPFYGQEINGSVTFNGKPVPSASVLLLNSDNEILHYTFTGEKGKYDFLLKTVKDSVLVIKVNAMSYEPQTKTIKKPAPSQNVVIDFQMFQRTTALKEVVVEARQPIRKKNDTITYDIEAFMDGSERVVEDLLKKLPGIHVEEDGTIKYNGKKIEKMLLGGDDLFGEKYTIGSKNIGIAMVDSIQAIDHYLENRLLDGLVDSENVALNIILKKEKTDVSGNLSLGYGHQDKYLADLTSLLVNKKSKGFLLASQKNTGDNNTPYDFSQGSGSAIGSTGDSRLRPPDLISEGSFNSSLKNIHVRQNNVFYASLNYLHNFSTDFSAKLNFDFYDDRLKRTNVSNFTYFLNDDTLQVDEANRMKKKPRLYSSKITLSDNRNPHFIWKYQGDLDFYEGAYRNLSTKNALSQNNEVSTENFFTKHSVEFTYRKKENNALEGSVLYSKGESSQDFLLSPGLNYLEQGMGSSSHFQTSQFDREVVKMELKYYHKLKGFKWEAVAGYNMHHDRLNSSLFVGGEGDSVPVGTAYQNAFEHKNNFPYLKLNSSYKYGKRHTFNLRGDSRLHYFSITDPVQDYFIDENHFAVDANFSYTYSINARSSVNLNYSYRERPPESRFLYEGIMLTGYRSLRNNQAQFDFIATNSYGLSYRYKNLPSLTEIFISFRADFRNSGYFFRQTIDVDKIISTAFLLKTGTEDYNVILNSEQYIHFLRTTFSLKGSYTLSFDKNLVNDSGLRNIESQNLNLNLNLSTGFKGALNFYGNIGYFESIYFLENDKQGEFRSLKSSLSGIYNISETVYIGPELNFISPDLSKIQNYLFFDVSLQFKPKESRFEYSVIARNLTGNEDFETKYISDYYTAKSTYPLLAPSVLAMVKYNF